MHLLPASLLACSRRPRSLARALLCSSSLAYTSYPPLRPLPGSVVKDTSSWNNKKELLEAEQASCEQLAAALAEVDEEGMRAKMQQASQERDEAQAALNRWGLGRGVVSGRRDGTRKAEGMGM